MTVRRSAGSVQVAKAIWYANQQIVEIRSSRLPAVGQGEARVRTLYSAISRGTERLIFGGGVSPGEWGRMRAPMQEGQFPFPVKYGYCAVGRIEAGPEDTIGKLVFCLHPHQDVFIAPLAMLAEVPADVPARRATLAANAETALNAVWDSGAGPADRIVIVGAGIVGLMVAAVAARLPGAEVTVVDLDAARRPVVEALGARFAAPADVPADADVVFHTSVSQAGLNTAIACAGMEGTIVELSWYGSRHVTVDLGGAFHSRRLRLVSSQVGQVSPGRRPRWSYARRMQAALALLRVPALDALVSEQIRFEDAERELPLILAPGATGLAPVIRYAAADMEERT